METTRTSDGRIPIGERLALRPREAASLLGISERKLRDIQHQLPRIVLGGVVIFPRMALERWLDSEASQSSSVVERVVDNVIDDIGESE